MESGHSYLEADSMHATIKKAFRHKKVYTTREWELIIGFARSRIHSLLSKEGTMMMYMISKPYQDSSKIDQKILLMKQCSG